MLGLYGSGAVIVIALPSFQVYVWPNFGALACCAGAEDAADDDAPDDGVGSETLPLLPPLLLAITMITMSAITARMIHFSLPPRFFVGWSVVFVGVAMW